MLPIWPGGVAMKAWPPHQLETCNESKKDNEKSENRKIEKYIYKKMCGERTAISTGPLLIAYPRGETESDIPVILPSPPPHGQKKGVVQVKKSIRQGGPRATKTNRAFRWPSSNGGGGTKGKIALMIVCRLRPRRSASPLDSQPPVPAASVRTAQYAHQHLPMPTQHP